MIRPLLEARAEIQKNFVGFLVQMKSLEFAFEINWPLLKYLIELKTLLVTANCLTRKSGNPIIVQSNGLETIGKWHFSTLTTNTLMTLQKVSIHYRTIMTYEQSALPTVIWNSEFHSEMFWMKQDLFSKKNILVSRCVIQIWKIKITLQVLPKIGRSGPSIWN